MKFTSKWMKLEIRKHPQFENPDPERQMPYVFTDKTILGLK